METEAQQPEVAGTGRMKKFGSAGFTTPVKDRTLPPGPEDVERALMTAQEAQEQAERRVDLVAAGMMGLGLLGIFIGMWLWIGLGVGLTTLGAGLFIVGFWTSYDNHRPTPPPNAPPTPYLMQHKQ